MRRLSRITALLVIPLLLLFLVTGVASAVELETVPPPSPKTSTVPPRSADSFWEKLERLREDKQLRDLVEEDLEKSLVIRSQIQTEVDRAFEHTTTLINVLLGILTFLPILAAVSVWFIRRSVLNQIVGETQQQLRVEVEKQFEQEIAAELKQQATAFRQEIDQLRTEFVEQLEQLKSLFSDVQTNKDQIIRELSQITPSPIRDSASPETQEKIHALTQQLERLKSTHAQLSFSAHDYVEQGKALYFEARYEEALGVYGKAIQLEPENPKAWFGRGATLVKLQKTEEAIAAYEQAIQLKPDFPEAWFGRGAALAKLQKVEAAIAAYEQATQLKPDFFLAWFGKARCYALQGKGEAALESLQQAMHLNADKCREVVKTDAAFDPWRETAQFQQLMQGG